MAGFSFRPTAFSDIHTIHQIVTQQNILDFGEPLRSVEDIQNLWSSPHFDLQLDSEVATTPNGEIAAYAELRNKEDVSVYLSNDYKNTELASHLLRSLKDRAGQLRSGTGPLELWGQVGFRNTVLIETFQSNGFTTDISFLVMEATLTEMPQAPAWPDGIKTRTFIPNQDEQTTYQADEEAAKDKGYHAPLSFEKWAVRMGMNKDSFDPGIWFLACANEEIAGVALNVYKKDTNVSWVDHLSVRRAWRNKGIGKALLLHTFREFFRRGIRTIKLSVDSKSLTNAPHLYESVGMRTIQKYHVFKKAI